ncbi:hypothetical protein M878_11915 [Streptomyces roseochromogenus subsp. oscitans DS 12.976]|uniref:Uncharacterized protein n=1 Tax=Streptomyces roseochromogenus subsp. oscitans DS 12.976 TaxID=1352936 RepID=V6KNK2_STRRC|nr:hypothetical protein M878_11915 [Streptomyces roseochromogenus subsp. oscitans DS 12.976]
MDVTSSTPQGAGRRLENGIAWAVRNADGVVAIVVAVVVGLMDVLNQNMDPNIVSGATLLVLAALVYGSLTERRRRMADLRAATSGTSRAIEDLAMVRALSGAETALAHERARRTTSRWVFKGGTGTYLRAVTLPECVLEAQRQRRSLSMKIDIINPADDHVCAAYARFRSTFGPGSGGGHAEWTVERTRKEAYATVVAACWHRQRLDTLEIDVHLSSVAPALRFDLSDTCLIITQDDPSRVSLCVERDRPLYDYYVTELHQSREQAVKLDLREAVPLTEEPTVDEVRRLLDRLGLPLAPSYTDRDVGDIIDKALRAENPYRR